MSKPTDTDRPALQDLADRQTPSSVPSVDDWDALFDPSLDGYEQPEFEPTEEELENVATPAARYLGFRLGREHYAVPILGLSEVVRVEEITAVPRVRSFVLGIVSVRGTIVPIIDLRRRLAFDAESETARGASPQSAAASHERLAKAVSRVLITKGETESYGLLVDAVSDVFAMEPQEIEPPPATLPRRLLEFVSGLVRVNGVIHIVLDVAAVLRFQAVAPAAREVKA